MCSTDIIFASSKSLKNIVQWAMDGEFCLYWFSKVLAFFTSIDFAYIICLFVFIFTATPDAPDKPKLTDSDRDFIQIEWMKPYDGGSPIKGYLVQRREATPKKDNAKGAQQAEWTTITRNPVKVLLRTFDADRKSVV